jgi:hypothetical protein
MFLNNACKSHKRKQPGGGNRRAPVFPVLESLRDCSHLKRADQPGVCASGLKGKLVSECF